MLRNNWLSLLNSNQGRRGSSYTFTNIHYEVAIQARRPLGLLHDSTGCRISNTKVASLLQKLNVGRPNQPLHYYYVSSRQPPPVLPTSCAFAIICNLKSYLNSLVFKKDPACCILVIVVFFKGPCKCCRTHYRAPAFNAA